MYEDLNKEELSRSQPLRLIDPASAESHLAAAEHSNHLSQNFALSTQDEQFIGQFIGSRYRLDKVLGAGGMSIVFLAFDVKLQRLLAVKLMHAHLKFESRYLQRFQQEGKALSKLDHPNIVKVFEYGLHGNMPYMVMEYIEGTTLATRLKERIQLPIDSTLEMAIQVCGALNHAHRVKVIHRDLKPSNIMIRTDESGKDMVKIVDFGIAKIASDTHSMMTGTGEVFGSPVYMSPEQCEGRHTDRRTDLYSLGCVMYESLAGTPPFVGDSPLATMMKHQRETPISLQEASLGEIFPNELERIIQKLLSKSPDARYQDAALLVADLDNVKHNGYAAVQLPEAPDERFDTLKQARVEPSSKPAFSKEAISHGLQEARDSGALSSLGILLYAGGAAVFILAMTVICFSLISSSTRSNSGEDKGDSAENLLANVRKDSIIKWSSTVDIAPKSEPASSATTGKLLMPGNKETDTWNKLIATDPRAVTFNSCGKLRAWYMLDRLNHLMDADFSNTSFNSADLAFLRHLPLRRLNLTGLKVSDAFQVLTEIGTLKNLTLDGTDVRDADLSYVNPGISSLSLAHCLVTDSGMKPLRRIKSLRDLDLRDTRITDGAIKELTQMHLDSADIRDTRVSKNGIDILKRLQPNCIIYCN